MTAPIQTQGPRLTLGRRIAPSRGEGQARSGPGARTWAHETEGAT